LKDGVRYNNPGDLNTFASKIHESNLSKKFDDVLPFYLLTTIPTNLSSTSPTFAKAPFGKWKNFDETRDAGYGIYHIKLGSATGIFKKASFSKEDFSTLRTSIYMQAQKDYTIEQTRYKYSINADFIGSSLFYFGAVVCPPFQSTWNLNK
jgi:hypothetical protein